MKTPSQLQALAASDLPAPTDDRAFRADMSFVDTEAEMIAFVERFGVARTTVIDWRSGRFAPHPSARARYGEWLRERARQKLDAQGETGSAQMQAPLAARSGH